MSSSRSSEQPVFDSLTQRMIVGALAVAFPTVVIALTGKVTSSISASYHEVQTRDVFVGFLFIIGAFLISYKGHKRKIVEIEPVTGWERAVNFLKRYQEDIISTIGGFAGIFTALYPTARDGDAMDPKAWVHVTGAFILFANVGYFCLIAFLRSLNEKLMGYPEFARDTALLNRLNRIRNAKAEPSLRRFEKFFYRLLPETGVFLAIVRQVSERYDRENPSQGRKGLLALSAALIKFDYLLKVYGKKLTRGTVYVFTGLLIVLVLIASLPIGFLLPDFSLQSKLTFVVETISLVLFGIAWGTASRIPYVRKIQLLLALRQKKQVPVTEPVSA